MTAAKTMALIFLGLGLGAHVAAWSAMNDRPWLPIPGRFIGLMMGLGVIPWMLSFAGFALLLVEGALEAWARWGAIRFLIVFLGTAVLEICTVALHDRISNRFTPPNWAAALNVLALVLPGIVIVGGGFFRIRALFLIGTFGTLLAASWRAPDYIPPSILVSEGQTLVEMVKSATYDVPERNKILLERAQQQPDWVQQVAASLDADSADTDPVAAAFFLSLKPDVINEDLQEKCWQVVRENMAKVTPPAQAVERYLVGAEAERLGTLSAIVTALVLIAGPVRERHRGDFEALRDLAGEYRKLNDPDRALIFPKVLQLPDLAKADWKAGLM